MLRWLLVAFTVVIAAVVCLRSQKKSVRAIVLLVAALVVTLALLPPPADLSDLAGPVVGIGRPVAMATDGYVGAAACQQCHADEHRSWHNSYHRTMTQLVTPDTVLTDLSHVSLTDRGQQVEIRRKGDEFFAEFDDPLLSRAQGRPVRVERKLVLSTGSHHMQMYWHSLAPNTPVLSLLPFAYLKAEDRWAPRDYVFLSPHQPQPRAEIGRWNMTCIQCHATHGKSGILEQESGGQNTFDAYSAKTSVAEFGISCEECHGPGEQHVAWAKANTTSSAATNPVEHAHRSPWSNRRATVC